MVELDLEPGAHLRLTHDSTGHSAILVAEPQPQKKYGYLLALQNRPYHRLTVATQKAPPALSFKHSKGQAAAHWSLIAIEEVPSTCRSRSSHGDLIIVIRPLHEAVSHLYLSLGKDGSWSLASDECRWHLSHDCAPPSPDQESCHDSLSRHKAEHLPVSGHVPASIGPLDSSFAAALARDGFCVLHSLIPSDKCATALRFLNHHLGSADLIDDIEPDGLGIEYVRQQRRAEAAGSAAPHNDGAERAPTAPEPPEPAGVVKLGKGHTCTCCLAQAAPLLALLDGKTRAKIATAIGSPQPLSGRFGVQVALRFPLAPFAPGVADGDDALPALLEAAGLDWHTDAAKYNDKKVFDIVIGIFLSPVRRPSDGALFVRPGSHASERRARAEGQLRGQLHSEGAELSTAFANPTSQQQMDGSESNGEAFSLAQPILCEAGSVIVFDKDLLHAGGPNLAAGIRYALYARMRFEPAQQLLD